MILDSVHLMYEAGYNVLPNNLNPLKQGWVRPPNAMDGIPAPLSVTVNTEDSIISKVKTYTTYKIVTPSQNCYFGAWYILKPVSISLNFTSCIKLIFGKMK